MKKLAFVQFVAKLLSVMKQQFKTKVISDTVHIDTSLVPDYVIESLGQTAFNAIQRDYKNPEIYAGYLKWKKEREEKPLGDGDKEAGE